MPKGKKKTPAKPSNGESPPKKPAFEEPTISWGQSKAKQLLVKAIKAGTIPMEARDDNGKSTMPLKEIYESIPELKKYDYKKFSSRLSTVRASCKAWFSRAKEDEPLVMSFIEKYPFSTQSSKGYIEYQGSEAQKLLLKDIDDGVHLTMTKKKLWASRPEYYENFPLKTFRDKFWQEIRTEKYLHTIVVKGKRHKAS